MTDDLKKLLEASRRTLVLTGAGVSTLSGIPDFRGTGGIYSRDAMHGLSIEDILSIDCFRVHPEYYYELKLFIYSEGKYQPNIVHTSLAQWEKDGLIHGIYTQNIDRLHTIAGSSKVYELHGSAERNHCFHCGKFFSYQDVREDGKAGRVPKCDKCGGPIKPDIVFYGENLDEELISQAWEDFSNADLAIVLGSSLVVTPAATLPALTLRHGGKLVIVNAQPTNLDGYATLHYSDLKEVFR